MCVCPILFFLFVFWPTFWYALRTHTGSIGTHGCCCNIIFVWWIFDLFLLLFLNKSFLILPLHFDIFLRFLFALREKKKTTNYVTYFLEAEVTYVQRTLFAHIMSHTQCFGKFNLNAENVNSHHSIFVLPVWHFYAELVFLCSSIKHVSAQWTAKFLRPWA